METPTPPEDNQDVLASVLGSSYVSRLYRESVLPLYEVYLVSLSVIQQSKINWLSLRLKKNLNHENSEQVI